MLGYSTQSMKRILFSLCFVPSLLSAQSPPPAAVARLPRPILVSENSVPQSEALPDNYQLTLTLGDDHGQVVDLTLVVASKQFRATLGDQGNLTFAGTLSPDDSGGMLIAYTLEWQNAIERGNSTEYRSSSTGGSVRLQMGKEVPILRVGNRTARLSIKKFQEPVAK